jgi:thiol-disulfide isomerase/thioredoxin
MKKYLLILLNLAIVQVNFGQSGEMKNSKMDPFCQMIHTIYSKDVIVFNSRLKMKQVFETDTTASLAKVLVVKKGKVISYLLITPEDGEKELLYYQDTAWVVDHQIEKLDCIGTGTADLQHNSMAGFFSFTIFNIDTLISQVEPFWKVIEKNREFTVVAVEMSNNSPDLSDVRAEYTIGNSDRLLYKTLQEVVYLKADNIYQEQIFSDYSFPDPGTVKIPEYYSIYDKDLSIFQDTYQETETEPGMSSKEIFLENAELYDSAGNTFILPSEGLILIDLWYVGCAPCMKSAPVIEKLFQEYQDQVYFFSVNEVDRDKEKISRFCEKMGISFPVLIGGSDRIATKVSQNGGYPVFILVDGESRKVLWSLSGYTENLEEIVREAIIQNL